MGNSQNNQSTSKKFPFMARNQDQSQSEFHKLKDDLSKTCKLSLKTRLIVFGICCIVGWILSIMGTISLFISHNLVTFAILFSIGTITNIIGSCFLAGPVKQMKSMVDSSPSTIATLVLALTLPSNMRFIVIITLIIQVVSYLLYTLSYIPFANRILKRCFKSMVQQS